MRITSIDEVLKVLNKLETSKSLSSKDVDLLTKNLKVISYSKGETIYKQGATINDYAILIDGMCKITAENPLGGNGTIITLLQPVKFVGIFSLYDTEYTATATAIADSTIAFVEKNAFRQIMLANGKFCYSIFEILCKYTKNFVRMTVDFSQKTIMARVASSLLYISEMINGDYINIPISRNDLAEYSGIATGSTIRLLSELEAAGVIMLDKKTILIKDKEALRKISMQGDEA